MLGAGCRTQCHMPRMQSCWCNSTARAVTPSELDVTQGGSLCSWMQGDALLLLCKSDGKVPPKGFVLSCSYHGMVMLGCISSRNQPEKPGSTRDIGDRSHSGGGTCWHSSFLEQYKRVIN